MRHPADLVGLLLLVAPWPALGADLPFAPGWEAAFAEARERNVPVLFVLAKDSSRWSAGASTELLAERVVVVIGHPAGGHASVQRKDAATGAETSSCPLYPSISCEAHARVYDEHAGELDYTEYPAAFLLGPDGAMLESGVEKLGPKTLIERLDKAQEALGRGVRRTELVELEQRLAKGDAKLRKALLKAARRVYEEELEVEELAPMLARIVEKRLERLDAEARTLIAAARDLSPRERHETLKRIAREMQGRAPAEEAAAVLAELEATPGGD